jgi:hypothetical protein
MRSGVGNYHQVSAKHLGAYLDELRFRFNNQENPYMFRDVCGNFLANNFLLETWQESEEDYR